MRQRPTPPPEERTYDATRWDFGDDAVRVDIHSSDEIVAILIEAHFESLPEERRRFAFLNIPRPVW